MHPGDTEETRKKRVLPIGMCQKPHDRLLWLLKTERMEKRCNDGACAIPETFIPFFPFPFALHRFVSASHGKSERPCTTAEDRSQSARKTASIPFFHFIYEFFHRCPSPEAMHRERQAPVRRRRGLRRASVNWKSSRDTRNSRVNQKASCSSHYEWRGRIEQRRQRPNNF